MTFKKLVSKIILWEYFPKNIKAYIQCSIYSNQIIKYRFKNGEFITRFRNNGIVKTIDNPFSFNLYNALFFDGYIPRNGDFVIDAGGFDGHIGSLMAFLVGEKGMVYSFEPDNDNYKKCVETKSLNKIENLALINEGLWNSNTVLKFYSNAGVTSSALYDPGNSKATKIKVCSIDDFVNEYKLVKVDFIKMNIEGSEIEAIKGAVNTLSKFRPKIVVAADHFINGIQTYSEIISLLKNAGYNTRLKRVGKGAIVVIGSPD